MMTRFITLCNELNLPVTYEKESNLISLKTWCYNNISQDTCYQGSAKEQYNSYFAYVENYLDNFIAHLPSDRKNETSYDKYLNALHYAAQQGYDRFITNQAVMLKKLINTGDDYGMTPLHKAATQGHLFTVRALLSNGANAQETNKQMQLPIHCALIVPIIHDKVLLKAKESAVRELLPLTPKALKMKDKSGSTLFHLLATYPFKNILADLIKINPELAFINNNASHYPIHTAILNHQQKSIDLLLSINNVANLTDEKKRLPIHYAARYGNEQMVQSCYNANPTNINSQDTLKRTPLILAAYENNQIALESLMKYGADPQLTDNQGLSILHIAVQQNNAAMVRWIIENVGDFLINQNDVNHQNPLDYAKLNDHQDLVAFLKSKGATDCPTLRC